MQRRSAAGDSSPNVPACRSRRGEAPEGSSLLSPRVEARSAEDRGRGCQERYTTPPGCRTYQRVRQPVRHPCGVALSFVMPDPRVFGATPLDLWLRSGHPQGVLRSPLFTMSWMSSVAFKCVTPAGGFLLPVLVTTNIGIRFSSEGGRGNGYKKAGRHTEVPSRLEGY